MDLYINSYGTYLHKVGEMFELEAELDGKKIKQKISPLKIKSIIINSIFNNINIKSGGSF